MEHCVVGYSPPLLLYILGTSEGVDVLHVESNKWPEVPIVSLVPRLSPRFAILELQTLKSGRESGRFYHVNDVRVERS